MSEEKVRNRIVIIGNGFDLEHGLKSKYGDFLLDYFRTCWIKKIENNRRIHGEVIFEDELIKIKYSNNFGNSLEMVSKILEESLKFEDLLMSSFFKNNISSERLIGVEYKSVFLKLVLRDIHWNDLETTYFKILLSNLTSGSSILQQKKLNEEFTILRQKFIEYLKRQEKLKLNGNLESKLDTIMEVEERTVLGSSLAKTTKAQKEFYSKQLNFVAFVNFNYTNVLDSYINHTKYQDIKKDNIQIHGNLSNEKTIVFGYGDDQNEHFDKMERTGDNEYLKFQKSSFYGNDNSYQRMLFAMEQEYDVVVFGHSLGLSDKTLLNTLLEHDNCKHIHLIHRNGEDGHFKQRMNLSRHFKDKTKLRARIFPRLDFLE